MSGGISKQEDALNRGAQLVVEAKADLNSQLSLLKGNLQGIGSHWAGQGAVAFTQAMTRWEENAKKIITALDEFERNLKDTEASYAASDAEQQQAFGRLSNRLG